MSPKVVHISSVHRRYDTRIFVKECISLVQSGYDVSLVIADGKGDEKTEGVKIFDVGEPRGRLHRMSSVCYRILRKAKELEGDLFHFHDPELLWVGFFLKLSGKRVIYDSHEDVPRQIAEKEYLPALWRKVISYVFEKVENLAVRILDAVVTPTPFLQDRFKSLHGDVVLLRNFPRLSELQITSRWEDREKVLCYIGEISENRGIYEMVRASGRTGMPLELGGRFRPPSLVETVKKMPEWEYVRYHGYIERRKVVELLGKSRIGLILFANTRDYREGYPVKMFEYMAAGMPFVASDFPAWRTLLEGVECCCFVPVENEEEIHRQLSRLTKDDKKAKAMGEQGRRAVVERFNWEKEEKKLLSLYQRLSAGTE